MPEADLQLYAKYIGLHGLPSQRAEWLLQQLAFVNANVMGAQADFTDFALPSERLLDDEPPVDDDDLPEFDLASDPIFKDFQAA